MRLHLKGLVLSAALSLSSWASAEEEETHQYVECTREPSEADLTAAKAAFQAGNVSFNEADYPRAILYWEDAFRRDCTANPLLLNLARAYELNGQKRQAVIALETFLQREPNTAERAQIARRIEVLKKQIESEPPPAPPAPAPAATSSTQAEPQPETNGSEPPPDAGPSTTMRVLPWVVVGVGGVVTLTGVIVYANAHKDVNHYKEICNGTQDCPQEVVGPANDASKRENTGKIVTGTGLVVLAGGFLWYALTPRSSPPAAASAPRTALTPVASPGYAGVLLDGRF